jgi:tripartite-type tricarboxylate transporter receptor subunit TctC
VTNQISILRATLLALTAAMFSAAPALAQTEYPTRAIKIIVPFPPGATVDTLPRIVGEKLSAKWSQPVVIENRTGAAGNIGADAVAKADPDGYTLLSSPPPPLAINQALYPRLSFDPAAFVPVTILAEVANVLVVRKDLVPSLKALIENAKAHPGKLTYGSAGNGSTPHLTMEWLKLLAGGMNIVHVPYRGSAPALTDLLGGQVDMMFDNLGNTMQYIEAGKIVAVAVGSAQRLKALPDVPTLSELFPGAVSSTWFGVVAPPKTPPALAAKISDAITEVINQPDVAKRFEGMSAVPVGGSPEKTAVFIKSESERWKKVIAEAGIKAD